ncbi:hypothetical protein E3U96_08980 [Streptococcus pseudopneumoniae]|nr:hypothetical protein E3V85_10935 [Streptococcus pseudopneumoniae]TMR44116.1 hypothetical protein E3U96_08640 [Streptococcus pseudopneumoniae]TMR44181.1 hypothetical protein E3U96_08980 [Streptococcus pseudopneumoniae]TMR63601.1 hypothetical protein E3V53_07400 [Streptococcus pseudopneumoniae]TMR64554.1 hypothetical protein E3V88_09360 [Streptococcus pseudopneumoniae]
MRPRRYPYSGKRKKQSDRQIAKLKRDIDVNRTNISSLKFVIETLSNHQIAKLKRDIDVNRTNISSLKFVIETLSNHQNYR